jgi:hypothetical protein
MGEIIGLHDDQNSGNDKSVLAHAEDRRVNSESSRDRGVSGPDLFSADDLVANYW